MPQQRASIQEMEAETLGRLYEMRARIVEAGAQCVFSEPQFEPALVLDLIEREQATVFAAVPTMYQMMIAAPNWEETDLSTLRFCTSGGAPLPVKLVEQFLDEKGVQFKQGFGMSEFGPGVFALAQEDAAQPGRRRRKTSGWRQACRRSAAAR